MRTRLALGLAAAVILVIVLGATPAGASERSHRDPDLGVPAASPLGRTPSAVPAAPSPRRAQPPTPRARSLHASDLSDRSPTGDTDDGSPDPCGGDGRSTIRVSGTRTRSEFGLARVTTDPIERTAVELGWSCSSGRTPAGSASRERRWRLDSVDVTGTIRGSAAPFPTAISSASGSRAPSPYGFPPPFDGLADGAAANLLPVLILAALTVGFLFLQGRVDRRDPRLVRADVRADVVSFG